MRQPRQRLYATNCGIVAWLRCAWLRDAPRRSSMSSVYALWQMELMKIVTSIRHVFHMRVNMTRMYRYRVLLRVIFKGGMLLVKI